MRVEDSRPEECAHDVREKLKSVRCCIQQVLVAVRVLSVKRTPIICQAAFCLN